MITWPNDMTCFKSCKDSWVIWPNDYIPVGALLPLPSRKNECEFISSDFSSSFCLNIELVFMAKGDYSLYVRLFDKIQPIHACMTKSCDYGTIYYSL